MIPTNGTERPKPSCKEMGDSRKHADRLEWLRCAHAGTVRGRPKSADEAIPFDNHP